MAGPWEKYQNTKQAAPSGPWDKFKKASEPSISAPEAAAIGVQQGITFGARPFIGGVGGGIGQAFADVQFANQQDKPLLETIKNIPSSFGKGFQASREELIKEQEQALQQQPGANIAGQLGGGFVTAPLVAAKGLLGAARLGAAQGAGTALGESQSLSEAGETIGKGTAFGLAGGLLGKGIEGASKVIGTTFEKASKSKAFGAAGAMLKDFRKAFDKGKVDELGETIIKHNLVGAGDEVGDVALKSKALLDKTGKEIGSIYNNVLDTLTNESKLGKIDPTLRLQIETSGFRPESQQKEMLSKIESFVKGQPGSTNALSVAQRTISELAQNGDNITPQDALKLKGRIDGLINYSVRQGEESLSQEVLRKIRGFISDKINKQVELIDKTLPSPQSESLKALNKLYGNVSEINSIAADRALREEAKNFMGLGDKLLGGVFASNDIQKQIQEGTVSPGNIALSLGKGLAVGLGSKGVRTFGPAAGVSILGGASKFVPAAGKLATPIEQSAQLPLINAMQRRQNANNR